MTSPTNIELPHLREDQLSLLVSLIEFALGRYQDNRFPLVESYVVRLRELQALVARAKPPQPGTPPD